MTDFQVYDNFLEETHFNEIEKLITMHELPWYTTLAVGTENDFNDNLYYQTHTFFEHHRILSPEWFDKLTPLINKLDVKSLIRIRANMYASRENISTHGFHMLSLFLPGGTSLVLAFLLVPIEIVSYIFKPLSLAVRLFANMMAGHTLLKVIAGFAWAMMGSGGLLLIAHVVPLGVLVILFGLELAVALIQAYVFTILSCIYINDAIVLH